MKVKLFAHPVRTGQTRRGFTGSRDFRSTELTTSLGENAVAGQECPAYLGIEI